MGGAVSKWLVSTCSGRSPTTWLAFRSRPIRKANKIFAKAEPVEIVLEEECRIGFDVRYNNGQTAEVSWAFIRELPPKK